MITFSKLGKKGNIGNQLFQIASVIGVAKANNQEFVFSDWKLSNYFENKLPEVKDQEFIHFQEKQYHFEPLLFDNKNYDLEGWFQSESYFYDIETIKYYFKFKEGFISEIREQFKSLFDKRTILISIRRGDFVDHQDYFQLPINFYLTALSDHFPNWKNYNILVLSDDIKYCKFHFSSLENVFFADTLTAIQQLILASLCNDFIISNSTFSWWCAWLGEKKDSKIIRPLNNFSTEKRITFNDKDYFPNRWTAFDFTNKKINLSNIAIVLKTRDVILEDYLKHNFTFLNQYNFDDYKELSNAQTNFIFIGDYVPSPVLIFQSSNLLKSTIFYSRGRLLKISRVLDVSTFSRQFDFGIFARLLSKKESFDTNKIVVVYLSNQNYNVENLLEKFNRNSLRSTTVFDVKYCFSGKIISLFEFKFFMITKFEKWIRTVKKNIKKHINYKNK